MSFLNVMVCCYFSLEVVSQSVAKNNSTEKKVSAEIKATLKQRQRERSLKGKCEKVYRYKLQR